MRQLVPIASLALVACTGAPNIHDEDPTCEITAPADGSVVVTGDVVTLEGAVVDDTLTWTWSSDRDGQLATGTGDASFSTELSPGPHAITLAADAEEGTTCEARVAVTVSGRPTVAIDAPASGAVLGAGPAVTFEATVGDDDTDPDALTLRWESDLDGILDTTPADASGAVVLDLALTPGAHVVTLTAVDAHGLEASADVLVTIDRPPSAPVVHLTPANPLTADDLVVQIVEPSTDPEGDEITYTYAWTVDGVATAHASDTVPHADTLRGEVWSVVVTPHDPHAAGLVGTASVTIGDTPPTLDAVTLGPDPARVGDVLTCTPGEASDADGDAITFSYGWSVDGEDIDPTSTTLTDFAKGDVVACVVTPVAGLSGDPVASGAVTIADTPPVATSVTLTPTSASEASTLTCGAIGTDADDDAITWTYTWTVSGTALPSSPSASLTGDDFDKGDVVTCAARPTADGVDGDPLTSAAVQIQNTPPGPPVVAVTPERPVIGEDDLRCAVTVGAPDADDDVVTYDVAWTVDGQPYPSAFPHAVGPLTTTWPDDTVPADDLALGYDWTCTAFAKDDEADGGSATASTPRAVCDGATIEIAYLPAWGSDHTIGQVYWLELESDASRYGDCLLAFTSLTDAFESQLPSYDLAILMNPSGGRQVYSSPQIAAIRDFAGSGGGLLGTMYFKFEADWMPLQDNSGLMDLFGVDPSSLTSSGGAASLSSGTVVGVHPITRNVPDSIDLLVPYGNEQGNADGWSEEDLLTGARFVIHGADETSVIAYEGDGSAVYFTGLAGYALPDPTPEAKQVLYDAIVWAAGYR